MSYATEPELWRVVELFDQTFTIPAAGCRGLYVIWGQWWEICTHELGRFEMTPICEISQDTDLHKLLNVS